ncbi:MAG: ECF-type sigma factor [Planctomycetota bacterium]
MEAEESNKESNPVAVEVAQLLRRIDDGDASAGGELFQVLYPELRRGAEAQMRDQPASHSLQATALVNEAFLRLRRTAAQTFSDRRHFLLAASRAMRHVLIDYARKKGALKRGGEVALESLGELVDERDERPYDIEALELALLELEKRDGNMAKAVELRFFAGLSPDETARVLKMPRRSFDRRWRETRDWLRSRLA